MLVRLRSPPEIPFIRMPPIKVSLQDLSPSLEIISRTLTSIWRSVKFVRNLAANLKLSSGVKVSRRTSSCWTNAPNFPKSLVWSLTLFTLISPVIFEPGLSPSLYPNTFRKLVLPLPLAPMTAISSPGLANPVNPCRTYFFLGSLTTALLLAD